MLKFKMDSYNNNEQEVIFNAPCHFVRYIENKDIKGLNIYYVFSTEVPSCFSNNILFKINGESLIEIKHYVLIYNDSNAVETSLSEYLNCENLYFATFCRGKINSMYKITKIKDMQINYISIYNNGNCSYIIATTNKYFDTFFDSELYFMPNIKVLFKLEIEQICKLC